ncbi:MAG TPA: hypothetical protein VE868_05300 [Balneolaceae bacterium]|nr:hypothetical protein [Balneolaceae bacterium]
MKTQIYISGQVGSAFTLYSKINSSVKFADDFEVRKDFFNYRLIFKTKKLAVDAMAGAYQRLKRDEMFSNEHDSYRRGEYLSYDAGKAEISRY